MILGESGYRRRLRRCRQLADSLPAPFPFDAGLFIEELAKRRGRPIALIPMAGRPTGPCGLLATTDRTDYIFYASDTSPLHQQHIILHEAAHLLLGHDTATEAPDASPAPLFGGILNGLPAELVHRVLGRSGYTEPQEQDAELLASLLPCRSGAPHRNSGLDQARLHPGLGLLVGISPYGDIHRG